jgi:uncharacterized protein
MTAGIDDHLASVLATCGKTLIAYSGGVDSAYLLWTAHQIIPGQILGVLADSPSLARSDKIAAIQFAEDHQLPVRIIQTAEVDNPHYRANPLNRCFFCKHELFAKMALLAQRENFTTLAYGENADDLAADRPGSMAAASFRVRAPLREAGLAKAMIRSLASAAGLSVAEKVASPCLASRIPHGTEVTPEILRQVEAAEQLLRELGFHIVRVRHHGPTARLQVPPAAIPNLLLLTGSLLPKFQTLGYTTLQVDPQGYTGPGLN